MVGSPIRTWLLRIAGLYLVAIVVGYFFSAFSQTIPHVLVAHWDVLLAVPVVLILGAILAGPGKLDIAREYPPPDEGRTIEQIVALLTARLRDQYKNTRVLRDTHPKSNGLVKGTFVIEPGLKGEYRVGLFKEPGTYDCWCRFSNSAPEVTPDKDPEFRGLAIKLFEVPGEKLIHDEEGTFDFMFVAHDTFFAGTPKDFLSFFANATHYGETIGGLIYAATHWRGAFNALRAIGPFPGIGQRRHANPSEINWFSVAPFLFGEERAVKYSITSREPMTPLPENPPGSDYLRVALTKTLATRGLVLDFNVQFQADANRQPIEDTTVRWKASRSPWIRFATLEIPPQDINDAERLEFDENLTFNPWHCLPEHRPLGGVNRARRDVMRAIQEFRLSANQKERSNPLTTSPR